MSMTVKCQKQLWCHVLSKIGAVRQLEMQSELISQIKSSELDCIVLFLYTIISSRKGICHITMNLFLLHFISLFAIPFLCWKRKDMKLDSLGRNFTRYSREKKWCSSFFFFFLLNVFLDRFNCCKPWKYSLIKLCFSAFYLLEHQASEK